MTKNDIKEWFRKITANKKRLVLWIILLGYICSDWTFLRCPETIRICMGYCNVC